MSKTVDEIYLSIAQNITDAIEENWEIAVMDFEYTGDSGGFQCFYKKNEADLDKHDFDVEYNTYEDFELLYNITSSSSNRWNKAKFTLFPTGKFNIDFEWDQSLADEIENLS